MIFKGLSVNKNCHRPESVPLSRKGWVSRWVITSIPSTLSVFVYWMHYDIQLEGEKA